jgi:phage terminase small subunit
MKQQTRRELAVPEGLSARAQVLWREEAGKGGRTQSECRAALLEECLRHLDAADRYREIVIREGATITTTKTGVTHAHPCSRMEQTERMAFTRLAKLLGLNWVMGTDGRA